MHVAVEGPTVETDDEIRHYTVCSEIKRIHFAVMSEERERGGQEWRVRIDGIPDPCIVHDTPWTDPEQACRAALQVVRVMLELEEMQQAELRGRRRETSG